MKASFLIIFAFFTASVFAQRVAPYTADYYRVSPSTYLDKEITLAVAYVMPANHPRDDGMPEMMANTYNLNQFGGHIPIISPPEVAERLARQCGTMHVWNHSHTTFIKGVFKQDQEKKGRYCVFVEK